MTHNDKNENNFNNLFSILNRIDKYKIHWEILFSKILIDKISNEYFNLFLANSIYENQDFPIKDRQKMNILV